MIENNGRILVVDDTPANLHLLSNLLEERDYEVRAFPSAKLALMGMKNFLPELILLDITMPQMNGYEMCEYLKEDEKWRDIPVIFISALNEIFDKVKAFSVGGVDYITKPVQAEEVLARVETHLQLFRLREMLQKTNFIQSQKLAQQNRQLKTLNQELEKANKELKEKYLQLEEAQLQLVQNEKMVSLGNLVTGIAHEINNPLGFIGGNVRVAQEYLQDLFAGLSLYQKHSHLDDEIVEKIEDLDLEFLVEDFPKLIASMQEGYDIIRNISTSLRTFARTDIENKTEFNLHDGIDSTLLILKYRLKANENRPAIEVVKNYGALPLVKCYTGQLNQVFMNLLANAIDALDESNEGKTFQEIEKEPNRIRIETELSEDNKLAIVSIADNGTGMPEEVKVKIFEQGFTTKAVGKGTGLGMAIAHQIVTEKHGGMISCDSKVGQGTIFTIIIPR
ncbi:MAG: hybrid sensor histidine kinase/response regulator [Okeania sp. SIO2F4]|uniref:hybrid sensor histidine kinase/response regulator n=1 Tax=Okeania sp. SIO2F4 TaxID=2607790 RepID=UPI00142A56FC|nr:response regulator [Okeania sp. SIO2F4]NES02045.1 hybrid sensor histidine kinase/response regulator [Okeania sp. SIO2F4]